jgi:hypothetical protein
LKNSGKKALVVRVSVGSRRRLLIMYREPALLLTKSCSQPGVSIVARAPMPYSHLSPLHITSYIYIFPNTLHTCNGELGKLERRVGKQNYDLRTQNDEGY